MTPETVIEHGGKSYHWKECLYDFAGNTQHPGHWADLWEAETGERILTMGGAWEYYFKKPDLELPTRLEGEKMEKILKFMEKDCYDNGDNAAWRYLESISIPVKSEVAP